MAVSIESAVTAGAAALSVAACAARTFVDLATTGVLENNGRTAIPSAVPSVINPAAATGSAYLGMGLLSCGLYGGQFGVPCRAAGRGPDPSREVMDRVYHEHSRLVRLQTVGPPTAWLRHR